MSTTKPEKTTLPLDRIQTDGGTQPRAGLMYHEVADYAEQLRNGATFPPVEVVYDGTQYWLVDGFHRVAAHRQAEMTEIAANVTQGTREDAVWTLLVKFFEHSFPCPAPRLYGILVHNRHAHSGRALSFPGGE